MMSLPFAYLSVFWMNMLGLPFA
jgi:hypothetical protein